MSEKMHELIELTDAELDAVVGGNKWKKPSNTTTITISAKAYDTGDIISVNNTGAIAALVTLS